MRNIFVAVMVLVFCIYFGCPTQAKPAQHSSHKTAASHKTASRSATHTAAVHGSGKKAGLGKAVATAAKGRHGAVIASKSGRRRTVAGAHHLRHQRTTVASRKKSTKVANAHTRYAYPMGFFMLKSPDFDRTPLARDTADNIARSFNRGFADEYAARSLVRAGVVNYHPLRGGIFWRREPIKYIIVHSTETGIPVSAVNVIEGWNSAGRRHPGAQYVVDRDGTIFQAVDPDLATVHINIFKTLPGINNDNSIGIEMNHTGRQDYPAAEREAVIHLVTYLQERYKVADENVITHRYAQQGDHTDPVNFDWDGFLASKNSFKNHAIAYKVKKMKDEVKQWSNVGSTADQSPPAYLQPHQALKEEPTAPRVETTSVTTTTVTTTTTPPVTPPTAPIPSTTPTDSTSEPSTSTPPTIMMTPSPQVAPPQSPKSAPSLRGPIEMQPESAPSLNTMPTSD